MPKRGKTWIEVAVYEAGFRKAIHALTWVNMWGVVREDLGHVPTVDEVSEWWNDPVRNTYREQAAFRACFPSLEDPTVIADQPEALAAFRQSLERWHSYKTRAQRLKAAIPDLDIMALGFLAPPPGTFDGRDADEEPTGPAPHAKP